VTSPFACISENLTTTVPGGLLQLAKHSVPRLVVDQVALSGGDGALVVNTALPGKLLIDKQVSYVNEDPIPLTMLIRVTRGTKFWETSNPNAIQFRDRWSYAIDETPPTPITSSVYNSAAGGAVDVGTNSVAEPNPGLQYIWVGAHSSDEWVPADVNPGELFSLWYRCYVWTPPPWSDNANKSNPVHSAFASYARIQLIVFPTQGQLVSG
jgi:hypothetical protein